VSVRDWLQTNLSNGCDAAPVFKWADAQGKARNTVLIQARKLGFKLTGTSFTFVGEPPPAQPRAVRVQEHVLPDEPDQPIAARSGRGTRRGFDYINGVEVVRTIGEWTAIMSGAVRCVKHRECADVLIMKEGERGQVIAQEVYDW